MRQMTTSNRRTALMVLLITAMIWTLPVWAADIPNSGTGWLDQLGDMLADWVDRALGLFDLGDDEAPTYNMGYEIEPHG